MAKIIQENLLKIGDDEYWVYGNRKIRLVGDDTRGGGYWCESFEDGILELIKFDYLEDNPLPDPPERIEWIPVEKDLPDIAFEYVWVCYGDNQVATAHHLRDEWWTSDKMTISHIKVTHWMPIIPPDPPESIKRS